MESESTLTTEFEPPIVDHGDGQPPVVEDDAGVAAATESDAAAEPSEAAQSDASDEQTRLALTRGWVEREKWKGGGWVDAGKFNQKYEEVMPHVTRENRRMREEMRARDTELAQMRAEMGDMRKHYQDQQEASRTMQVQTLLAQKAQAESEGDWQTANKIGNDLLEMKVDERLRKQAPAPQAAVKLDPVVMRTLEDFAADNPIFRDKQNQTYLAVAAKQLAEAGTPKRGRELLDEAAELAQQLFPTKFKPAPRRPAMAEMNGAPSRANGAVRSWADLKADEAKKQEDFIAGAFPKKDAKELAAIRQRLLKELPATAFRR